MENLKRMYEEEKMSIYQIAQKLEIHPNKIWRMCKKEGIKMRPFSTKGRSPRKGAVLSDETKAKISAAHKGKKLSKEHRDKVVKSLRNGRKVMGVNNPNWKGGVSMMNGYFGIRMPDHYRAHSNGYVKLCHLMAEYKYGRMINDDEVVHHIDHDKENDHPSNLKIMKASDHVSLHRREEMDRTGQNAFGHKVKLEGE